MPPLNVKPSFVVVMGHPRGSLHLLNRGAQAVATKLVAVLEGRGFGFDFSDGPAPCMGLHHDLDGQLLGMGEDLHQAQHHKLGGIVVIVVEHDLAGGFDGGSGIGSGGGYRSLQGLGSGGGERGWSGSVHGKFITPAGLKSQADNNHTGHSTHGGRSNSVRPHHSQR